MTLTAITELASCKSDVICSTVPFVTKNLAGTSFAVIRANNTHCKKIVLRRISVRVADGRDHWLKNPNTIVVAVAT